MTFARYNGYPVIYTVDGWEDIATKSSWTFATTRNDQDYPYLQLMTHYGTREMRWDVFEEGWKERQWKWPPVPGRDGYVGSVAAWNANRGGLTRPFDPATDDIDDVTPFPLFSHPRAIYEDFFWFGRLVNGSDIAPGKYK